MWHAIAIQVKITVSMLVLENPNVTIIFTYQFTEFG